MSLNLKDIPALLPKCPSLLLLGFLFVQFGFCGAADELGLTEA